MNAREIIIGFILIILVLSLASAQEELPPGSPPCPLEDHLMMPPPVDHLSRLKEMLDLSKDQVAMIEAIMDSIQSKFDVLQDKVKRDRCQSLDAMKKIMDEGDTQIENIFTDSQKRKFERMKEERDQHRPPPEGFDDLPPRE
jgi:hypothetical protein